MLTRQHWARRSEQLDPVRDSHQISLHVSAYDFPWDNLQALSFALFRTYAVPSIGRLLDETGEFTDRVQKRYDDTGLLLEEVQRHGLGSDRGRSAVRRINQMHAMYDISNDEHALRPRHVRGGAQALDGRLRLPPAQPERGRRHHQLLPRARPAHGDQGHARGLRRLRDGCSTTTSASTSPSTPAVAGWRTRRST